VLAELLEHDHRQEIGPRPASGDDVEGRCVNATRKILRTAEVKVPSSAIQGTVCA
jgi:hypothetical protein